MTEPRPRQGGLGEGLRRKGLSLFRTAWDHSAPHSPLGLRLGGKEEERGSFLASRWLQNSFITSGRVFRVPSAR